jgi:hypothetical protein
MRSADDTPPGYWEYASLAAAESSGDPWQDGDDVQITGGALFLYKSALVVDGYSGLIHKYPYGVGLGTSDSAIVRTSTAKGSDPDTWGWTDFSSGVKGSQYDFDVISSRSRAIAYNGAGRANLRDTQLQAGDSEGFVIIPALSATGTNNESVGIGLVRTFAYASTDAGANRAFIGLEWYWTTSNTNWSVFHGGLYTATTKSFSTERRAWMYVKDGRYAVWFDDDATPELSGTNPRTATFLNYNAQIDADGGVGSSNIQAKLQQVISGAMTTS